LPRGSCNDPGLCAKATRKLLQLENRPDCILFPDDYSAIGGIAAITEAGLSIPDDISVLGYDGIHLASVIKPRLTTYKQDTVILGKTAAAKLVELIEHPKTALLDRIIIPGRLLPGETVKELR